MAAGKKKPRYSTGQRKEVHEDRARLLGSEKTNAFSLKTASLKSQHRNYEAAELSEN